MGLRLLLDTHTLYWQLRHPRRLSTEAFAAIEDAANDVFVSAVSLYELTFKARLGRLKIRADLPSELHRIGITELPLRWEHARVAGALPLHHRDPFDRMLVAQAQVEGLTVVTRDPAFAAYQVGVLPA